MTKAPVLGCIADDFTGASDLASFLIKGGVQTIQINGVPSEQDVPTHSAEAFVIALKSRTCPAQDAISQALQSLSWLQKLGCTRFYFKYCSTFDSSDKGNIGPVLDALMSELKAKQTLVCPALPINGRTVYFGNLFVNGVPLSESPMSAHPITPMKDSNILRLLSQQVKDEHKDECFNLTLEHIHSADPIPSTSGARYLVADAISQQELSLLAKSYATCKDLPLLSGGSGLAEYFGPAYRQAGWLGDQSKKSEITKPDGPVLILSGSCSEATRKQVMQSKAQLPAMKLDPLLLANGEQNWQKIERWLGQFPGRSVMLYSSANPDSVYEAQQQLGEDLASSVLESCMAEVAVNAVRSNLFNKIVVAGGETSGAIVSALSLKQFIVGENVSPGVPLLFTSAKGDGLILALKSGNFGTDTFFLDAIARMT